MRKKVAGLVSLVGAVALIAGFMASGFAQTPQFEYVGVSKCKMCHKSEKSGGQYTLWENSKHAKAFEALASPKAMEIAKAKGIEDPQKADACLKCHATAAAVPADKRTEDVKLEDGVTCETCHGPGSAYKKKSVMEAIYTGAEKGETYGLTVANEETCKRCHNEESPTYDKSKPFDFKVMSEKIAHPVPKT